MESSNSGASQDYGKAYFLCCGKLSELEASVQSLLAWCSLPGAPPIERR